MAIKLSPSSSVFGTIALVCLGASLALGTACGRANSDDSASLQAEGSGPPQQELRLKRATATGPLDESVPFQTVQVTELPLSVGGIPVTPTDVLPGTVGPLVIDNRRDLLVQVRDGSKVERIEIGRPIRAPVHLREVDGLVYLFDNRGLMRLDQSLQVIDSVLSFRAVFDFVPVAQGILAFDILQKRPSDDEIIFSDSSLKQTWSWSAGRKHNGRAQPADSVDAFYRLAHLAPCDGGVAAAYVHRPLLYLIDPRRQQARSIPISIPGTDELLMLEKEAQRNNKALAQWHPSFFGGVACTETSLLAMLDAPDLRVYQFSLRTGALERVLAAGSHPSWKGFKTLTVASSGHGLRLYTIADTTHGEVLATIGG
jgi:hypothetical protein